MSNFRCIFSSSLSSIGVFFLDPRKPILPADDQEITSPFLLVNEMMMLLKDAVICASPEDSTITLRFFSFCTCLCHCFSLQLLVYSC